MKNDMNKNGTQIGSPSKFDEKAFIRDNKDEAECHSRNLKYHLDILEEYMDEDEFEEFQDGVGDYLEM